MNCDDELREVKRRAERLAARLDAHEFGGSGENCAVQTCACAQIAQQVRRLLVPLPTIQEMSGLVHDFTDGLPLKEYMERIND
jgi:hypothetical protein